MKKFLLLAAIATTASVAKADAFSDIFLVTYNGEKIENGQTITVNTYIDLNYEIKEIAPDLYEPDMQAQAKIKAENISEEPWHLTFTMTRTAPGLDEFPSSGSELGFFQLCYEFSNGNANCIGIIDDKVTAPDNFNDVDTEEYVIMDVDQRGFTSLTPVTFKLELNIEEGGEIIEGGSMELYVNFTHESDISAAVDGIISDNCDAVYYNLQGVKVSNPREGEIYIVRKGQKCEKVIFK